MKYKTVHKLKDNMLLSCKVLSSSRILLRSGAFLGSCALLGSCAHSDKELPLNIVLINLDDAGNGDFSFKGGISNSPYRQTGGRRSVHDQFLCGTTHQWCIPRRTYDRMLSQPYRFCLRPQPKLPYWYKRQGRNYCRTLENERICHSHFRQMASGRCQEIPATPAWFR